MAKIKTLSGDIAATLTSDDDDSYKSAASNNEWKEVHITMVSGGKAQTIWDLFGGNNPTAYFAKNLKLFLDSDTGVSFKVSAKYVPVLEQLMKKFKDSMVGKAVGLIQKMSDLAAGLDINKAASQLKAGTISGSDIFANIKALPANVRYQTKYQNLPAWESTGPLELGSFTFKFYLGMAGEYNARTEVYNPALAFMKVNQPSEVKTGVLQGPLPNTAWVYGVIGNALGKSIATTIRSQGGAVAKKAAADAVTLPPEPKQDDYKKQVAGPYGSWSTVDDVDAWTKADADWKKQCDRLKSSASGTVSQPTDMAGAMSSAIESGLSTMMSTFEGSLNDAINAWPGTGLIQLSIGKFVLPEMTVENTDVKFSYDTDENGYPIWAEVTWSGCKTLKVATVQQMPLHDADSATSLTAVDTYKGIAASAFPEVSQITAAANDYGAGNPNNANAVANAAAAGGVTTTPKTT